MATANSMQSKLKGICEDVGIVMNMPQKRDKNFVSFDMKVQLAEKFRLALPETLVEIVKLVESHSKNLIEKHSGKFIQIKFDNIDSSLYRKIFEYFLFSILEEQPKIKKIKLIESN